MKPVKAFLKNLCKLESSLFCCCYFITSKTTEKTCVNLCEKTVLMESNQKLIHWWLSLLPSKCRYYTLLAFCNRCQSKNLRMQNGW
jgi:hypothetical protein